VARAEPGPNEIFDLLSWVIVLPLGIVQIAAAVWIGRRIGRNVLGWTVLATLVSLAAGIAVVVSLDDTLVRPVMLALYFCPGIPTFIALARRQLWAPALLVFSLLPGLLAILPR
jgi:voltage-gated potassium channel Kch